MRIAILTFHRAFNCGAMLQAWALKTVLEKMGHTVLFPVCNHVGEAPRFFVQSIPETKRGWAWVKSFLGRLLLDIAGHRHQPSSASGYINFRKRYLPEKKCRLSKLDEYCDCVVVGSDQVWNKQFAEKMYDMFTGKTLPKNLPAIAYAVSTGDAAVSQEDEIELIQRLPRFSHVSLREPPNNQNMRLRADVRVEVVLDPTLLLTKCDYDGLASGGNLRKPYVYLYTLSPTKFEMEAVRNVADRLGIEAYVSSVSQPSGAKAIQDGIDYTVSPARMINLIREADYVLASSFHATVLSIIYKKKFVSLRNEECIVQALSSRTGRILERLGLTARMVCKSSDVDAIPNILTSDIHDYTEELSKMRGASLDWLKCAVSNIAK